MSQSIRVVTLAVALVFVLASVAAAAPASDTVIVKFKDGTSAGQRSDALDGADVGRTVGTVPGIGARVVRAEDRRERDRRRAGGRPRRRVRRGQPALRAAVVPNDPLFARQSALQVINAPAAWDARALAASPSGGGPVVGIVDSGVRTTHEDLQGAISGCLSGQHDRCGLRASPTAAARTERPRDERHRHDRQPCRQRRRVRRPGLQLARRSCARRSTPTTSASCPTSRPASSRCENRDARIINLSLVGPPSDTLYRAIEYAYGGGDGALVVAASGNDGTTNVSYPAGYPEAMSVAATDNTDSHPAFSTSNADVEVSAPAWASSARTTRATRLRDLHGHVHGRAAGVGSGRARRDRQPVAERSRPRSVIDSSAVDLGAPGLDPLFGYGRIDAARAVAAAGASVGAPVEEPAPTPPPAEEPAPEPSDQESAPSATSAFPV